MFENQDSDYQMIQYLLWLVGDDLSACAALLEDFSFSKFSLRDISELCPASVNLIRYLGGGSSCNSSGNILKEDCLILRGPQFPCKVALRQKIGKGGS